MDYAQTRDRVGEDLRALAETIDGARALIGADGNLPAHLRELADGLEARFVLAVVGEFSSGKSYLLNALLGRFRFEETGGGRRIAGLLATDINPSTASITELEYGTDERAVAVYAGGRQERVPLDVLSRFVAVDVGGEVRRLHDATRDEKDAPERVRVFLDSPFLHEGFVVADTPGLASVNPAHRRATLAYLPGADAVLYLIDTQTPFTDGDASFLAIVRASIETVFIVQTKIDLWRMPEGDAEAWENAYRRIRAQAELHAPGTRVFPLSARDFAEGSLERNAALVARSRFPEFVRALEASLVATSGKSRLRRVAARAAANGRTALERLAVLDEALSLAPNELAARRADCTRAFEAFAAALAERIGGFRNAARELQSETEAASAALREDLIHTFAQSLDVTDVARLRDRAKLHVLVDGIFSAKFGPFAERFAAGLDRALDDAVAHARERLESTLHGPLAQHAAVVRGADISKLDAAAREFGGAAGTGAWANELVTALRTAVVLNALGGPAVAFVDRIASRFAAFPPGGYMKRELIADLRAEFFPSLEDDLTALARGLTASIERTFAHLGEQFEELSERIRSSALGGLERAIDVRRDGDEAGTHRRIAAVRREIESKLRRIGDVVAAFAAEVAAQLPAPAPNGGAGARIERAPFDPEVYARGLRPTRWRVGVLGATKRGKSSLINAIAGERVVADEGDPSGDGFAFPVHVRYGPEPRAFSLDAGGEWCEIGFGSAAAAARSAPVLIEVPWKMPRELVLVHAPAFDSGDPYAEEIALAVAAASHETLCLFSRQLSDRELALFEDVARAGPEKPMLFAHTLADNEAPSERRGVVELAQRYLSERGIVPRRIFTISALDYRNARAAGRAPSGWNELGALIATIEADADEHMTRLARLAAEERSVTAGEPPALPGRAAGSPLRRALDRIFGRR